MNDKSLKAFMERKATLSFIPAWCKFGLYFNGIFLLPCCLRTNNTNRELGEKLGGIKSWLAVDIQVCVNLLWMIQMLVISVALYDCFFNNNG